jgi:hypothetical protein
MNLASNIYGFLGHQGVITLMIGSVILVTAVLVIAVMDIGAQRHGSTELFGWFTTIKIKDPAQTLIDAEWEQGWKYYCDSVMFGDSSQEGYDIKKIEEHCG